MTSARNCPELLPAPSDQRDHRLPKKGSRRWFIPVTLSPVLLAALGCVQTTTGPSPEVAPTSEESPETPPLAPEEENGQEAPPPVTILSDVGFLTPESVYFDRQRDVYLVSNINGAPHDKDGNGFISKVTPDGTVTLKFIDGEKENVDLDAPKGLTVSGDTLYVADIDRVRMFDALTGEPKGEILIKKATFINDVATGKDGVIYVSDSGLDPSWESTGTDAVYTIRDGTLKKLIASKTKLGSPNGLTAGEGGVWVTTRSGELYWVSDKGKLSARQKVSGGSNDGILVTTDGRMLISSWTDGAVLSGKPGEEFHNEVSGLDAPADIGFDCQRDRVLIPLFKKNSVIFHSLSELPLAAQPEPDPEEPAPETPPPTQ